MSDDKNKELKEALSRVLTFGKYKEKTLGEVYKKEPSYVTAFLHRIDLKDKDLRNDVNVVVAADKESRDDLKKEDGRVLLDR